jgi:hypothetical protein
LSSRKKERDSKQRDMRRLTAAAQRSAQSGGEERENETAVREKINDKGKKMHFFLFFFPVCVSCVVVCVS